MAQLSGTGCILLPTLLRCAFGCKTLLLGSRMPRRWKVLELVSVGVFMVSLDLFIVNIAFPEIEGDFAGSSVSAHLLGAERLRDRARGAAWSRPVGWPTGTGAPRLPWGSGSSCWARRCAGGAVGRGAGRRARDPGSGRGAAAADLARAAAARVRAGGALARRSASGQPSAASRPRPGRRSAACWSRSAGGSCSSSTSRSASSRSSTACACCTRAATRQQERPDLLGSALHHRRDRRARARPRQGAGVGLGGPPHARRRSPPRPSASPRSGRAA